ncbi:MAG: Rne/Rng family ribonuclease [Actinobacteria bacterium]|nr:Rne/Rng family ribonuclease [Actinomycetota bacterium]
MGDSRRYSRSTAGDAWCGRLRGDAWCRRGGAPLVRRRRRRARPAARIPAARAAHHSEEAPSLKTQILVSVDRFETRVALLEDGHVAECHIERRGKRSVVGHVWKGRVESVLPGMEAAFVQLGLEKSGFLHVDEIYAPGIPKHRRQIGELLKKGSVVLVQALKDPMGTKGARLTMQLSLAGRFLVYVPYGEGLGVSKRIDDAERRRLKSICGSFDTGGGGVIVRTAAAGAGAGELARDLASLRRLWAVLEERSKAAPTPSLLYSEADASLRVIRDLLGTHVDDVLVDDDVQHERIRNFLRRTSPELADRVRRYEGAEPMMRAYGVDAAVRSTLDRRVSLPSGGYLIIDDTEAMTVIDVNSGRNVGRGNTNLEATITRTNLEAAEEVVRQLRLRDIGGIVVIDFIDMSSAKNRRAVSETLDRALAGDRSRTYVVEISELGLVQMTRQNISDGPREVMTTSCPTCHGHGFVLTDESHAIEAERTIRGQAQKLGGGPVRARVNPRIARILENGPGPEAESDGAPTGVEISPDERLPLDGVMVSALEAVE